MEFQEMTKLGELISLNEQVSNIVMDEAIMVYPLICLSGTVFSCDWYAYAHRPDGKHYFFLRVTQSNDMDKAIEMAKKILAGGYKVVPVDKGEESWLVEIKEVEDGTP